METIKDRKEIVTNGCSGGCCTAFTFPFTVEDLKRNVAAIEAGQALFTDERGFERRVINDNSIQTIIDMLIFVEKTEIDPQMKNNLTEDTKNTLIKDNLWTGSFQSLSIVEKQEINRRGFEIEGEKVVVKVYTCKHFDKENKICNNYENRPHMCRNYGHGCKYENCCYGKQHIDKNLSLEKEGHE